MPLPDKEVAMMNKSVKTWFLLARGYMAVHMNL